MPKSVDIRGSFRHKAYILSGIIHVDGINIEHWRTSEKYLLIIVLHFVVLLGAGDFVILITKLTETEKIVFQSFNINNSSESGYSIG